MDRILPVASLAKSMYPISDLYRLPAQSKILRIVSSMILLVCVMGIVSATAQVRVQLRQPPPNQLRAADLWKLALQNPTRAAVRVKLEGTLDEAAVGRVARALSGIISLPPGSKSITYDDVKRGGSVNFTAGKWREAFMRTGSAPSGEYTICITVRSENGEELGTDCIQHRVEILSPPSLLSPSAGGIVPSGQPPVFSWLPPSPAPRDARYTLRIVEVSRNQSADEAMQKNRAWFEKSDIRSTMFQYPVSARSLESNKSYAWSVRLMNADAQQKSMTSETQTFLTGGPSGGQKSMLIAAPPDTSASIDTSAAIAGTGTAAVGDTIHAGLDGEFSVVVSQLTTETDGSFTGQGKARIIWLKTSVAVEFKNIRVDSMKRLTTGAIVTSQSGSSSTSYTAYPQAWGMSWLSGPWVANKADGLMNWSNAQVDNLVNWVNNDVSLGQPLITYQSNIPPPPIPNNALKMPFGLQFNNGNDLLIITEIIFKPNESKINFLAQTTFSKSGTVYTLGFAGKYFHIHPTSIDFSTGRVELAEDTHMPNVVSNPKMKFTFLKGTATAGCFIQWDSTGITNIQLALDVRFSREWLLPIPASADSVMASIAGSGTSMQDVLLTGNLPDCEIVGTNGFTMHADSIALDLSDIRNPSGIQFPVNYPTTPGVDWQGFYVQSFGLTLPSNWKTGTNLNPPTIIATRFTIDDMGLTTKVKALNVFNLQSGRVADLSASLDTVEVSIISSSLVSGNAKGTLVLPISDVTAQNTLKYTATFSQPSGVNTFQIVIVPFQPIGAEILKGKMTLLPTSNLSAAITPTSQTLSVNLNGTFNWDNPILNVTDTTTATGGTPIRKKGINGLKMELGFENVGLTYAANSSANTNTLSFAYGNWSFASPQKRLANFPVTIKKVYYRSLTTVDPSAQVKELVRGALMIDIVANLTDDIGGTTTVGAAFAVELNKTTKKFAPKFKGVFIDSISVYADQPAVKIKGYLKMYDNDPIFGDGFKAKMNVTFTSVSLVVDALVQFGNTVYLNNNQYYRYWRVEADAKFSPGIPFLTGVGFYGFGGGAFYNMQAVTVQRTAPEVGYKFEFTPKKSALGLMAKATIGTLPKVETFNADVSLIAQFSNSGGLTMIGFTGDFWLAAAITKRSDAKMLGGVAVNYTFPTKIFNLVGALSINAAPDISTVVPIAMALRVDGHTNKWYFKSGVPTNPNSVKVFSLNLYSYLMFGNDLGTDVPDGFTPMFKNNYFAAIGSYPGVNHSTGGADAPNTVGPTSTGKGFALGVGVAFNKAFNERILNGACRDWDIAAALSAGAEVDLALLEYANCGSLTSFGINGYRASGYLGLYFSLTSSIVGTHKCKGVSDKNYNLFAIKTGAWLIGKFPNPVYLTGSVGGQIDLFNHLINIPWNKSFEYGTDCSGTVVATANAAQEDKAADLKNTLITYVTPSTTYNLPVSSPIHVKYALVPNQVFDVAENQGDGTIRNRTFKMTTTQTLEERNTNGTWSARILHVKVSTIGEHQHYISAPLSTTAILGSTLSAQTVPIGINTNNGNTILASNGILGLAYMTSPVPPPPPPNFPNPIPTPVNHLGVDKDYRFVVTATLKELSGSVWVTAVTRTNVPISESKTKLFRTGAMPVYTNTSVH